MEDDRLRSNRRKKSAPPNEHSELWLAYQRLLSKLSIGGCGISFATTAITGKFKNWVLVEAFGAACFVLDTIPDGLWGGEEIRLAYKSLKMRL